MGKFFVQGGRQLSGVVKAKGSKNEALQVICATLLTDQVVTLNNLPKIADVQSAMHLLTLLGVQISCIGEGSYTFCARYVTEEPLMTEDFTGEYAKVRGSIMLLAPLLIRFKKVTLAKNGGDRIGRRGIQAHVEGLSQLGVSFKYDPSMGTLVANYEAQFRENVSVLMPEPSVTATANLVMFAALTGGTTTIYPAACEPHVQQLCRLLVTMGAQITGIGSNLLTIIGVPFLGGAKHVILPDMLEVGTFIGLAAATNSAITIEDVPNKLFAPVLNCFKKLGIKITEEEENNRLHIPKQTSYSIREEIDGGQATLYDAIWPGVPADLISVAIVAAVHAKGNILIHQKMFESRLFFVNYLIEMGAKIVLCDPHRVHVIGLGGSDQRLRGIRHMECGDIRAGIALLIAALAADGVSVLSNIHQIDRGYESIDERLRDLGASVERF